MLTHQETGPNGKEVKGGKKKRDGERDGKRRRHDGEESETEGMRRETMRRGDRDRVGGGLAERVGKGNRQPVYYQGSIEKHLGTNRTPPPCHPEAFSRCQPGPFSKTPGGSGRGGTEGGGAEGRKQDRGGGGRSGGGVWVGGEMEYPGTTPSRCFKSCILATALWV